MILPTIDWDPEIDTPATIAIIGAGPIGIEAALYARFLGYYVLLFDAGKVADSVLKWGHVPMFTPFGMNSSPLGLSALEANDNLAGMPTGDQHVTGREFAERYLVPLARTDLVYDNVHVHSRVHSISRTQSRRGQQIAKQDRADEEFRIVIQSKKRGWFTERADIVLDCSGTYHFPRALGPGGGMAIGEPEYGEHIERDLPEVLGSAREKYAGKHTLLVGSGLSAATTAVAFSHLIREVPETRLTWVLSHRANSEGSKLQLAEHLSQSDWFARRAEIVIAASSLLDGTTEGVTTIGAWGVERLQRAENGEWRIRLLTGEEETLDLTCDQLISAVGHRPDWLPSDSLQIARSPMIDAPISMSTPLPCRQAQDDPSSLSFAADDLLTTEPHYYILGSKSFGSDSRFLILHGYQQIRLVFSMIAGRANLDLYDSVQPQSHH